jgi:dihydropteroate synthase
MSCAGSLRAGLVHLSSYLFLMLVFHLAATVAAMFSIELLADLAQKHHSALNARVKEFAIKDRLIASNTHKSIMGVINLSPDSWYRESVCLTTESAVRRAHVLQEQGADIIDIGAESTLADAPLADEALQSSKLLPVLRGLKDLRVPVSVETYNLEIAGKCLEAGASVINLTGNENSEEFYRLAKDFDAAVIICLVQGRNVREVAEYDLTHDPIRSMYDYFCREIEKAQQFSLEKLFIDPGLGFYYKNLEDGAFRVRHQMNVFLNTFRLRALGYPVCHALPHAFEFFAEEVRCAEPFFALFAALGKTDLFRTHEVPKTKAVLDTLGLL